MSYARYAMCITSSAWSACFQGRCRVDDDAWLWCVKQPARLDLTCLRHVSYGMQLLQMVTSTGMTACAA